MAKKEQPSNPHRGAYIALLVGSIVGFAYGTKLWLSSYTTDTNTLITGIVIDLVAFAAAMFATRKLSHASRRPNGHHTS